MKIILSELELEKIAKKQWEYHTISNNEEFQTEEKMKRMLEIQDELMNMHGVYDVYHAVERFSIFALQQPENIAVNQVYITLLSGLATAALQPYDERLTFPLLELVREAAADIIKLADMSNEELSAQLSLWHPDAAIKAQIFDINVLIASFDVTTETWSTDINAAGMH